MSAKRKNIILIICDQLRMDALGCYGNPTIRTPNIDALAASGVRFEQMICNSPLCGPARRAMYFGKYPFDAPAWAASTCAVFPSDRSYADHLNDCGYFTASIGRLDLIPEDSNIGFQYNKLMYNEDRISFDHYGPWYRERIANHPLKEKVNDYHEQRPIEYFERNTPRERALPQDLSQMAWIDDELDEFFEQRPYGEIPFFLHVGFYEPHRPWLQELQEDEHYALDEMDISPLMEFDPASKPILMRKGDRALCDFTTEQWRWMRSSYYSTITQLDKSIGSLMRQVKAHQLGDDTILLFISDHGEMLGDFQRVEKQVFYEGAIRIPFIISGPGVPQNETRECLAEQVDLLPTLLDIAQSRSDSSLPGISLLPAAREYQPTKDQVFGFMDHQGQHMMARSKTQKWYSWRDHEKRLTEVYDLERDPGELHNIHKGSNNSPIKAAFDDFFWQNAGVVGRGYF